VSSVLTEAGHGETIALGMDRFRRRGVIVLAGVLLGLVIVSLPVGAALPGVNGQIAWDNSNGAGTVYTANQDGKHVFRLTDSSSCCAAWSPDGKRLLVSGSYGTPGGRIGTAIVNADGTGFHALPLPSSGLNLACTVWSPDGNHCAAQGWDDQNPSLNGIYQVDVSDGSAVRLTTSPQGGQDIPGDYSPGGSQIVFGRYAASGAGVGLFIVNANGTGVHQLVAAIIQPANDGDWSPQGTQIVFSRHVTANVHGSIWIIKPDGSGLHQINVTGVDCEGAGGCHEPRWSPDGKKIVFATSQGLIYTMNADGTGLKQIAPGDDPVWGTHPDVDCTPTEKAQREKALAKFKRSMKAKRHAYFRTHPKTKARRAFVKKQKAKLKKLEALVAACG
jgi:Tol biopolymer transport system component